MVGALGVVNLAGKWFRSARKSKIFLGRRFWLHLRCRELSKSKDPDF